MRIVRIKDALHAVKPEGLNVRYYIFDEYEIHYNQQLPKTTQVWHHHLKVWETVYIIEGELLVKWKENEEEKTKLLHAGDLVETENTPHTFINNTDKVVKFLVIKQILTGENKREVLKNDKIVDKI